VHVEFSAKYSLTNTEKDSLSLSYNGCAAKVYCPDCNDYDFDDDFFYDDGINNHQLAMRIEHALAPAGITWKINDGAIKAEQHSSLRHRPGDWDNKGSMVPGPAPGEEE